MQPTAHLHLERTDLPGEEPASPSPEQVLRALKLRLQTLSVQDMAPLQHLIEYKCQNPCTRAAGAPDYDHFQASVLLAQLVDLAYGDVSYATDGPQLGRTTRDTYF